MARRKPDTFFHDMATQGVTRALISLSGEGVFNVSPDAFPRFQVYPSRMEGFDLCCDLGCLIGKTSEEKEVAAQILALRLRNTWAVSPFSEIRHMGGFVYFKIPEAATQR